MNKLLVLNVKKTYASLLDIESQCQYRIAIRNFDYEFIIGSLLECDYSAEKYIGQKESVITTLLVHNEILGDVTKKRVEVFIDEIKIGHLIEGVPVLRFGKTYAKQGRKAAYAYFNSF